MSDRPYARRDKVRQVQELRRSNATEPIPSKRAYRRHEKYRLWVYEELEDEDDGAAQTS